MSDPLDADEEVLHEINTNITLEDLKKSMDYIQALCAASLNDPGAGLTGDSLKHLCNPPTHLASIDDNALVTVIELYFNLSHADHNYEQATKSAARHLQEGQEFPSFGIHLVEHHTCINSCMAFTGPNSNLVECAICSEPCYDPIKFANSQGKEKVPHLVTTSFPLGPHFMSTGAKQFYSDFLDGEAYHEAVHDGRIGNDDIVVMMSIDGAQLYQSKQSDWIIPGPNKPKNVDSFLFPGFHHPATIQKEGLHQSYHSYLFLALGTADGPGLVYLNGLVGHHGKHGCHLFCSCGTHYYPALLKPDNFIQAGSDHADQCVEDLTLCSHEDYIQKLNIVLGSNRLATGISKPSIFLGFSPQHTLSVPFCFRSDIMHLMSLNIPDLLIPLWHRNI
ncbi:uncharacterized protein EDB91DRAFT_1235805 [Suillus paluster]|uniref:uncharacterized protein n=1 Tax=Suillus paluster TaxID=48578 RepID=UPI001B8862D3|nr:uncharacterized protein EDB91DRAFT_1235805 [Suillus paluster]KAG1747849.1 hypothetical protein EDB91DRAFT_1235805 [Suillus paluster]